MRAGFLLAAVCAATTSAGLAAAQGAEPVRGRPSLEMQEAVRDSYIVRFGPEVADVRGRANAIVRGLGGRLDLVYNGVTRGFAATLPPAAAARLFDADPAIVSVERDQIVSIVAETVPGGITYVRNGTNAAVPSGAFACVIDTGVDLDHPDLNVDTARSRSFVTTGRDSRSADDGNGHGTHVAGTIGAVDNDFGVIGVAPGVPIVGIKVLSSSGSGQNSWVIAGVNYAASLRCPVANMSLGGGASKALDDAVVAAAGAGVKFAIAAGNSSANTSTASPARVNAADVCVVAAVSSSGAWASFSNFGQSVDWAGPGVSITSTYSNGRYASLSGTSMAAPHIAGLLVLNQGIVTGGDATGDPDPSRAYPRARAGNAQGGATGCN